MTRRYRRCALRARLGRGRSALGHAIAAADAFRQAAEDLARLLAADTPVLGTGPPGRRTSVPRALTPEDVLRELAREADHLTAVAERFQGRDWLRTGWRGGREVSAVEVLRRAAHEAVHRLQAVHQGLARIPAGPAAHPPVRRARSGADIGIPSPAPKNRSNPPAEITQR